jgi:hypothetical protein
MLVYLTSKTWTRRHVSEAFAAQVRYAMRCHVRLLLAHEMTGVGGQAARHGCEFSTFFACDDGATPVDLLRAGIYAQIAVAMKGGDWRRASMVMLTQALTEEPLQAFERAPLAMELPPSSGSLVTPANDPTEDGAANTPPEHGAANTPTKDEAANTSTEDEAPNNPTKDEALATDGEQPPSTACHATATPPVASAAALEATPAESTLTQAGCVSEEAQLERRPSVAKLSSSPHAHQPERSEQKDAAMLAADGFEAREAPGSFRRALLHRSVAVQTDSLEEPTRPAALEAWLEDVKARAERQSRREAGATRRAEDSARKRASALAKARAMAALRTVPEQAPKSAPAPALQLDDRLDA